jgi:hypothetical protein
MVIIATAWLACSVLAYGVTLGYFDYEYSDNFEAHRMFAFFFSMLGPFSLVVALACSGFAKRGLRFKK